jgi:O-antigen/teichoic acid export membrane protein
MVCVGGLDVTIVGHYAYRDTAYYSIAILPTNFMSVLIGSMMGPVMPASSALSAQRSPTEMGGILARTTRYSTMLLLLTGLPLLVYGLPLLRLWVGPSYAVQSVRYLQILVLANMVRNLCLPYATMVAATGKLREATAAPVLEAIVNLLCSISLARRFGAAGVAFGTLIGSFVSISLHFTISMKLTQNALAISRTRLLLAGLVRPAIVALPSLLLLPLWWSSSSMDTMAWAFAWGGCTLLLGWFVNLNREERRRLIHFARSRLMPVF